MRRKGGDGWAYQGFNYPKSVWGGQLKAQMRKLDGDDRAKQYKLMGGTNTPWRRSLAKADGRRPGWRLLPGHAGRGHEGRAGRRTAGVVSYVKTVRSARSSDPADFIIDCTGLEADISEHRVLNDLLEEAGRGP